MEMENETKLAGWDDVEEGFVKLERDKAKMLLLIDWKLEHIKKFKDDSGNLKEQIEFSATVLSEDGKPANKIFTTTSFNALKGLKFVFLGRNTKEPVLIRIKKMGEGKSTVYDIEEQKINPA
jgi:hypothetical protein